MRWLNVHWEDGFPTLMDAVVLKSQDNASKFQLILERTQWLVFDKKNRGMKFLDVRVQT